MSEEELKRCLALFYDETEESDFAWDDVDNGFYNS